jgi:hypothetical protein
MAGARSTAGPDERLDALEAMGLAPGLRTRFRRREGERWKTATLVGLERDGSLGLRDAKGASRAIPLELVEVATTGPRGAAGWEPAAARVARAEQLRML